MPVAEASLDTSSSLTDLPRGLPFPPVTKSHILNCSYHSWYPRFVSPVPEVPSRFQQLTKEIKRYRSQTPKARLIPLPSAFLSYLRADGIILPSDDEAPTPTQSPPITPPTSVENSEDEDSDNESDDETSDPSHAWPETHQAIKDTIKELGGSVMPKLNWSAPKDATWISATNSMDCREANEVYLLLKSSDFIVHDLEQVFEGTVDEVLGGGSTPEAARDDNDDDDDNNKEQPRNKPQAQAQSHTQIPYHLILRKTIPALNPALEFRCFVRSRHLLCLCQRDLNHYDFLPALTPKLLSLIQDFFTKHLKDDFPDENFAFDVYVPPPHDRCWLVDVNPWAERTDPLLFSWMEILEKGGPEDEDEDEEDEERSQSEEGEGEDGDEESIFTPEFRLVNRDDPEAYRFNTPQYSAHKLPKDVVDAGVEGEAGLREFMGRWREIVRRQEGGDGDGEDVDED